MPQAPRLQEVQQNEGFESASSTPQGSHKGRPQHTGGEPVAQMLTFSQRISVDNQTELKRKKVNTSHCENVPII